MKPDRAGFERAFIISLLMLLCSYSVESEGTKTGFFIGFFLWAVVALLRRFISSDP